MSHKVALNTLSGILVAAIIYLVACLIDMQIIPVHETVKGVRVTDTNGVTVQTFADGTYPSQVKRGHVIVYDVRYYISHHMKMQVTRYLVGPQGAKRELTQLKFAPLANTVVDDTVSYPIPLNVPVQCGYTNLSVLEIIYPYNLLTRISPITKGIARGSAFCVTE